MIEIEKITGMDQEDIINLLLDQKEQPFNIYVPKSTLLNYSTNEDIAQDYAILAYAGQILNNVSDKLDYNYVPVTQHSSILFKVSAKDINKLAGSILELSYGYNNDPEDEEDFIYSENVYQFIEDVKTGKINAICKDFISIYHEYNDY